MRQPPPTGKITPREREVMLVLVQAGTYKEAASRLGLSVQTIKNEMWRARERTRSTGVYALFYRLGQGEFDE